MITIVGALGSGASVPTIVLESCPTVYIRALGGGSADEWRISHCHLQMNLVPVSFLKLLQLGK